MKRAPLRYWSYHARGCGTTHRGCAPDCPADRFYATGKWIGPGLARRLLNRILRAWRALTAGLVAEFCAASWDPDRCDLCGAVVLAGDDYELTDDDEKRCRPCAEERPT